MSPEWATMLQAWFVLAICCITGMVIGMRLERRRRDAEVDAWEIPEERLSDGAYWKKRYEVLLENLEEDDARRETT